MRCPPAPDRERRGVAAVELAIVLPFLLLLLLIVLDFGRVFYGSQIVSGCSQAGVIHESFRNDPIGYAESPYANFRAAAASDGTNLNLTPASDVVLQTGTTSDSRPMVGVSTTHHYSTVTNALNLPNTYDVTRRVWMREVPVVPSFP